MERQSWCSHQSPVPIPLLFIILAATDTLLQVRRVSLFLPLPPPFPDSSTLLFPSRRYARCIGKAQRPSSDEATFSPSIHPSVHGFAFFDPRSILASIFDRFSKIRDSIRIENLKRKFPLIALYRNNKVNSVIIQLHPRALFSLHAHERTTRRGRLSNSRYALAPAASRNKCAFGPIIIVVPARRSG